jgi:hypothetical protein
MSRKVKNQSPERQSLLPVIATIVAAVLGLVGSVTVAYFQFYLPSRLSIGATQTAEAIGTPLTPPAQPAVASATPTTPTATATPVIIVVTATSPPTPTTPAPTPTPVIIVVTATSPPTPTRTPTPIEPTLTPTSTPRPELMIEDFESYISDALLAESFEINNNAGNEGWVRRVGVPHVNEGRQAMAFEFDIRHRSPNDYIGFNRALPTQDWSDCSVLCVWIESDGSNRSLVIQFGESKNSFSKTHRSLSEGTGDYCVSLQDQQGVDLRAIGYYGIYVAGPPQGQSIIYIDNIRLRYTE